MSCVYTVLAGGECVCVHVCVCCGKVLFVRVKLHKEHGLGKRVMECVGVCVCVCL